MAEGDPLRAAFELQLGNAISGASIAWPYVDTKNAQANPDAMSSFITLRFGLGHENAYTWGSPGSNQWLEEGDVFIDLFPPLGIGNALLGQYTAALRNFFRNRRFAMTTGQTVRVLTVAPMSGGAVDGAWWRETIALTYRVLNIG